MKKLILLSLVFVTLFSCGDEVTFNTPHFQGDREYSLWRAKAFFASIDANGFLTITGVNGGEKVMLKVPSAIEGTYTVGVANANEAVYIDGFDTVYSTNNRDEDIAVYPEEGEIVIEEIDVVNKTFSGTFKFIAFDASSENTIGFNNGFFYKIPLLSGEISANPITCIDVEMAANAGQDAYVATTASSLIFINSTNFTSACNAYIDALNNQINYCGDQDGSIQQMIDDLGNCQMSCENATANVTEADSQYTTATIGNFDEKCAQYLLYLQEQITFCGDNDGSIQAKIDTLDCGDADGDGVPNAFEDFNNNGDLEDDDTDGDGTPNYLDNDDDGDGVLTQYEEKDENGNPIDTDGDGDVNYLDNDDDGDTLLTINENADPNGDGNPDDAVDTDGDGVPDYLQPA